MMFIHVSQNATRLLGGCSPAACAEPALPSERQTGGLSLSIERGTRAVSTVLSRLLFSIVPILFELTLVTAIMWHMLNGSAILTTVGCHPVYRAGGQLAHRFRRELNKANADANSKPSTAC